MQEFTFNKMYWLGRYYTKILSLIAPKYLYGFVIKPYKLHCFSKPIYLHKVITLLKNNSLLKLESLTDLVVVDNPNASGGRFCINYYFLSYTYNYRLTLKLFTNLLRPVLSIVYFYPSANWLEREAWDMYGIKFLLHADLRRILTDYGFQGHPLRKDFPLIGFVELRYDDSNRSIILEPVELAQDYRFFKFANPWLNWK
jgi:NADH:ubiquinone oxidoreductase subunit C